MGCLASSELWAKVGQPSGILTDEDILTLARNGLLITRNFVESGVKQTCYELRAGTVLYRTALPENERRQTLEPDQEFVIAPQEIVTIVTLEEVSLPSFVIGRIVSKGQFFSMGLSPVITFVDAGFAGEPGITMINMSNRTIRMRQGERIAKIEFEKLGKPVAVPYRGLHGFASSLWPIDTSRFLARQVTEEMLNDPKRLAQEAALFGEPFDLMAGHIIRMQKTIARLKWGLMGAAALAVSILLYFLSPHLVAALPPLGVVWQYVAPVPTAVWAIISLYIYLRGRRKGNN